jgi:hypothetical protein
MAQSLIGRVFAEGQQIRSANVIAFNLPPIIGLSTTGGFEYELEGLEGQEPAAMNGVVQGLVANANHDARRALKPPEITSPFFNNIGQNEKVSPRFFCLIRNLAPPQAAHLKKPTKLRAWRVSLLRQRAHYLGTVEAPDERAAEAAAVAQFDLDEEQRKRLARAGSKQLSLGGADASNVFHLRRT